VSNDINEAVIGKAGEAVVHDVIQFSNSYTYASLGVLSDSEPDSESESCGGG